MSTGPKLSVLIPAHNEEGCIAEAVRSLNDELSTADIPFEILVVNDGSTDATAEILDNLHATTPALHVVHNNGPHGFGMAIRCGLDHFKGDAVALFMADGSDRIEDLIRFYRTMIDKNVDCVFGTRFATESKVSNYPWIKLMFNRLGNWFINFIFRLGYNDVTNAFKLYSRETIEGVRPILSPHFNLTVELPLKAIIRGFSYAVVPNDWIGRESGTSKFRIKEMGSRYMFIILYCFLEKIFSMGDYHRSSPARRWRIGNRRDNDKAA